MDDLHEHCINIIGSPPFHNDCCIYRVHEGLRRVKPEAYEPVVVSLGPYHRQNPRLGAMENHKRWYLRSLLERRSERKERYTRELGDLQLVERARNCYAEPIDLNHNEFVEMMLLDGCFIIEFFRDRTPNPALRVEWMKKQICWDMMLLENQLPFFVLSKLYDMTKEYLEEPLMGRVESVFSLMVIPAPCLNSLHYQTSENLEIKHLLHLVHVLCYPTSRNGNPQGFNIINIIRGLVPFLLHILFNALLYLLILISLVISTSWDETRSEDGTQYQMNGAVELVEAGVKLKKVASANLFDIKFKDGSMEVPYFSVDGATDTFFRNLIAYEQHSLDVDRKYFTDFVDFMDQLISSEKDVELLRQAGIIDNFLGDDEEVSNLFNNLGHGVIVSPRNSYYSTVFTKVNRHCRKLRNRVLAKLMHDYFNNPWASISTLGAIALLGLAIAQTYGTYK